jgi:hypothetical protein
MDAKVLIIAGSRRYTDWPRLRAVCDTLLADCGPFASIWSGAAQGADTLGLRWASFRGLPTLAWPPDWQRYGKQAGVRRSADMIQAAATGSILAAFVPTTLAESPGTAHTVRLALNRKLAVWLVDNLNSHFTGATP